METLTVAFSPPGKKTATEKSIVSLKTEEELVARMTCSLAANQRLSMQ